MALINCPECSREVSDMAKSCPHCGYEINQKYKISRPREKKELSPNQKKIMVICIITSVLLMAVIFCVYLFLSPKTVEWCCIHKTKEATCEDPMTCTRCGKVFEEPLGHDWIEANCTEPQTCSICGETEGGPIGHIWINATCTEPKTCSVCKVTEGAANGHKWTAPSCTAASRCTVCGERKGTSLGHNVVDYICTRCKECFISRDEVKNVLDIVDPRYEINSVGGIDQEMTFVNKSPSKTINYITMEIEFYNAVGDVIKNDIGGDDSAVLSFTGPLAPGKRSSRQYWDACFYNYTFDGTMKFLKIQIEYSDGSVLVLNGNSADGAVKNWR